MNLWNHYSRPLIFAHRGASSYAPENTLASFQMAIDQHADAIELDVKLTKDNEIVVIHDGTVDRTTNGNGRVCDLTLEEIKHLDAGSFFSSRFSGEKIPTLKEVFSLVNKKILVNVELTNYDSPCDSLPEKVAELVKDLDLQDIVLFSSFSMLNLIRTRRRLPNVPVALLAGEGAKGWFARSYFPVLISPSVIHPHYVDTTKKFIKAQHKIGRRVHPWTVNSSDVIQSLIKYGCDGIFTDDPLRAKEEIDNIIGDTG